MFAGLSSLVLPQALRASYSTIEGEIYHETTNSKLIHKGFSPETKVRDKTHTYYMMTLDRPLPQCDWHVPQVKICHITAKPAAVKISVAGLGAIGIGLAEGLIRSGFGTPGYGIDAETTNKLMKCGDFRARKGSFMAPSVLQYRHSGYYCSTRFR